LHGEPGQIIKVGLPGNKTEEKATEAHELAATPNLPQLSSKQHDKLLLLSILPLASQHTPLTYQKLIAALPSISNTEVLESLLTTAFYAGLIHGSLDPHNQVLHVTSVAPLRDLPPGSIPALTETFDNWSAQCTSMLDELQHQIDQVHQKAQAKTVRDQRIAKMLDDKVTAADEKETGKRKQTVDGKDRDVDDKDNADPMDVDGEAGRLKGTKRALLGLGKKMQGSGSQI
jgi:COP9 signalosome complex subunit 7